MPKTPKRYFLTLAAAWRSFSHSCTLEAMYRTVDGAYYGLDLAERMQQLHPRYQPPEAPYVPGLGDPCGDPPILTNFQTGLAPCNLGGGAATAACLAAQDAAETAFLTAQQNWQACKGYVTSTANQIIGLPGGGSETEAQAASNIYSTGSSLPGQPPTIPPPTQAQLAADLAQAFPTANQPTFVAPVQAQAAPTPAPPVSSSAPSMSLPPTGNANAQPPASTPGSMFCFPGDTSAAIAPSVPICQYTALGAVALVVLAFLVLK